MPLGDSITEGDNYNGAYRENLYFMLDSAGIEVDYVGTLCYGPEALPDKDHDGHNGWTVEQILAKSCAWVDSTAPDIVLLMIGTNNMGWYDSTIFTSYDSLITAILTCGTVGRLFAASIPPLSWHSGDSSVVEYNHQIKEIITARAAAGDNVSFVDMYPLLTTADLSDGVHPNSIGHKKIAQAWFDAVMPYLATSSWKPCVLPYRSPGADYMPRSAVYDMAGKRIFAGSAAASILLRNRMKQQLRF